MSASWASPCIVLQSQPGGHRGRNATFGQAASFWPICRSPQASGEALLCTAPRKQAAAQTPTPQVGKGHTAVRRGGPRCRREPKANVRQPDAVPSPDNERETCEESGRVDGLSRYAFGSEFASCATQPTGVGSRGKVLFSMPSNDKCSFRHKVLPLGRRAERRDRAFGPLPLLAESIEQTHKQDVGCSSTRSS
jgi:hypothetical protein